MPRSPGVPSLPHMQGLINIRFLPQGIGCNIEGTQGNRLRQAPVFIISGTSQDARKST